MGNWASNIPAGYTSPDVIDRRHGETPSVGDRVRDLSIAVRNDWNDSFNKPTAAEAMELKQERPPMKKETGTDAMTTPKAKQGEGKPKAAAPKSAGPKGAELHSVTTRKLHDGTFAHEHHYKDKHGLAHHVTHEYSSADINDVKDHMQEHFGGGAAQPAGAQGEGEEGDEQDQTGQTAAPQASGAAAGGGEEEE